MEPWLFSPTNKLKAAKLIATCEWLSSQQQLRWRPSTRHSTTGVRCCTFEPVFCQDPQLATCRAVPGFHHARCCLSPAICCYCYCCKCSAHSRVSKREPAWSICEHWAQRNQLYKVLYVQFLEFPSSSMNQPTSCKHVQYAPWATDLNCGVELWMHRVKRYPSSRRHRRLIKIVRLRRS